MKKLIIICLFITLFTEIDAQVDLKQKLQGYVNPNELVTLSENISFDQAIQVLSTVSEKITGKRIVSTAAVTVPIGVELDKIQYKKALFIIAQYHNLMVEETESVIVVKKKDAGKEQLTADVYASVDDREVKITALMFEANVSEMQERGINWQFLLSRSGLSIGGDFTSVQEQQQSATTTTQVQQKPPAFDLSSASTFEMGKFKGNATALFRFFETENLGEIFARPTVTVRNNIQGRAQVGSDFSIKERDFAGNLIDKFYSTGTIIEVTPHIYNEDGIDYILLRLKVERSSAIPDVISTEIRKTEANTSVMLLDGEETAIGGLIVYEETTVRRGIPFLKDLPWWVFGIRYLAGYDSKEVAKKEIIMLIKAEILPSLKERVSKQRESEVLKKQINENSEALDKIKSQLKKNEEEK
jgi:type IV pilus assembly protein PilQ